LVKNQVQNMKQLIGTLCALMLMVFGVLMACGAEDNAKIKVLLVTGGHGFEQKEFFKVFEDNSEITLTRAAHGPADADAYDRDDLQNFDVVVLYDMRKTITEAQKAKRICSYSAKGGGVGLDRRVFFLPKRGGGEKKLGGAQYPGGGGKGGGV